MTEPSFDGDQEEIAVAATNRPAGRTQTDPDPTAPRAARREPEGKTSVERSDWGRSIRGEVGRNAWSDWATSADRPDPVDMLLSQSAARVPDLVPIRHGRMLVSPFTFYRGAALIMAADLARMPSSGVYVQACGDAHLSNFGAFATPQRTMAFDINDFDETYPAPFEWDVARLVASIVVAADDIGFDRKVGRGLAQRAARRYREQLRYLSQETFLDVWYSKVDFEDRVQQARETYTRADRRQAQKAVRKAQRKTNVGALDRLAERVDGAWRIKADPPFVVPSPRTGTMRKRLDGFFRQYINTLPSDLLPLVHHYRVVDFARKVVGVGSVGTEAHIALLIGSRGDDALWLQMKEATDSVLERYTISDLFKHQGERVVFGQRLMQASSDTFLGWASSPTRQKKRVDFYVRQLNDFKTSADVSGMSEGRLGLYVEVCAEALARAHARSGSASAISGYLGKGQTFDKAMGRFAAAYADQNHRDFLAFQDAANDGRVEVAEDI
jgi:uncharacterized protein (DUF2252 family)